MMLKALLGLASKDGPEETTEEMIAKAQARQGEARVLVAKLGKERGEQLFTGNADTLAACEAKLSAATIDLDRLDALIPLLRDRADAEARKAIVDRADAAVAECERACQAFKGWFVGRYPKLAAEMREGLMLEVLATEAHGRARAAILEDAAAGGGQRRLPGRPSEDLWPNITAGLNGVGAYVRLPGLAGPAESNLPGQFWPPDPRRG